eukprot:gene10490-19272_t
METGTPESKASKPSESSTTSPPGEKCAKTIATDLYMNAQPFEQTVSCVHRPTYFFIMDTSITTKNA